MTKFYHEYALDEILEIIKTNLNLLYNYNDSALINLRKYCSEKFDDKYKPLDYNLLIYYTEEALAELINADFLFDFRSLE